LVTISSLLLTAVKSRRRFVLLTLVVLAAVLYGASAWSVGSPRVGNSSGMAAAASNRRPSGAVRNRAPKLATALPPVTITGQARAADAPLSATGLRALPNLAETYLPDVIAEGGSQVKRWDKRLDDPIRVWIAPGDSVPGFRESFVVAVREAFGSWEQAEVPVRFVFVDSADDAEVRVDWAERLPDRRAGLAHWWTNGQGWLTKANLVFAMQLSDDARANETSMHRMALHEIGHLLGLEHSLDAGDIMAAWVNANELTARDRATARLLYTLPPGAISLDVGALGS
jgi:hypothetical protein